MTPYSEFLRTYGAYDRARFLAEVQHPHLLAPTITPEGELARFLTISAREANPVNRWLHGISILPVCKRPGGAFSHMVTLGRAENNDLVVPHHAVSKFHAYFRKLDRWVLCDADSLNGTRVDGQLLPAERSVPLQSGATILLGDLVEVEFLEPEDLYARVTSEAAALRNIAGA